jgi:hypothetical protein
VPSSPVDASIVPCGVCCMRMISCVHTRMRSGVCCMRMISCEHTRMRSGVCCMRMISCVHTRMKTGKKKTKKKQQQKKRKRHASTHSDVPFDAPNIRTVRSQFRSARHIVSGRRCSVYSRKLIVVRFSSTAHREQK